MNLGKAGTELRLHSHGDAGNGGGAQTTGRAVIVVPVLQRQLQTEAERAPTRTAEARLEEALGLVGAIDLTVVHSEIVNVAQARPATLIGAGKIAALADIVRETAADLVVFDHPLSPVQQRNLEKALNAKVLDRTGIILEIFGRRARTKEGALQVELAHLNYQKGRLVRSWTHLERQRGGAGFLGGPGETQIEADRRLLQEKINRLKKELETVRRTRDLHRSKRRKVPYPIVAIVGYTNAGKSTLFNRLTGAGTLAEDMLFATLDPTLRQLRLPHGTLVILSDTVGFISDLPTHLIAAFRATLEEVVEADLVLHLRDISDPDTAAQSADVERILADLGVDASDPSRVLEIWNKIDRLDGDRPDIGSSNEGANRVRPIAISAITGEGLDKLLAAIEAHIAGELERLTVRLEPDQLGLTDFLYRNGTVTGRTDNEDGSVSVSLLATAAARSEIEGRLSRENKG